MRKKAKSENRAFIYPLIAFQKTINWFIIIYMNCGVIIFTNLGLKSESIKFKKESFMHRD